MKKLITKIALAAAMVVPAIAGAATVSDTYAVPTGATSVTVGYTWTDQVNNGGNFVDGAITWWLTNGVSATHIAGFGNTITDAPNVDTSTSTFSITGLSAVSNYVVNLQGVWGNGTNFKKAGIVDITSVTPLAAVPEPETYAMMLAGLMMMGTIARRRRSSK